MNPSANTNYHHHNPNSYNNPYSHIPNYSIQKDLPNATLIQVFGLISVMIVFNLLGYIFGWIALLHGNQALRMYEANPQAYTQSSFDRVKMGRTCAMIGVIIYSAILGLGIIVLVILVSLGIFSNVH